VNAYPVLGDAGTRSDAGIGGPGYSVPCPGECMRLDQCGEDGAGNGLDDNCNGVVDEGCTCAPGAIRDCFRGPPTRRGAGICSDGSMSCNEFAVWDPCTGGASPTPEACDGEDDDCDAAVDEDCERPGGGRCGPPAADCTVADVLFLVDVTGSMGGVIEEIRRQLSTEIAPALHRTVGDLYMAVASYQDFPALPGPGDVPFQIRQTSTADLAAVQSALDGLLASGGGDFPESATEALYQSVTAGGVCGLVPPASCLEGGRGQACFRAAATPILVLITDAPFHNGPGGSNAYPAGLRPRPRTYEEAVAALRALDARVVGVAANGGGALADLSQIASDTGATNTDGLPIVIDGSAGSAAVVDGIVGAIRDVCGRPD
jgi:hypothetical protein